MPPFRLILGLFLVAPLAQADDFPTPFNTEQTSDADPMSAEDAAASFELPPGFEISVFASEPDVQNPIAMAWDPRGRMWVAENYSYAQKGVRWEPGLRDRVIILEDADWDGVAETRTVFTDEVEHLTSVETGHGGVWLMCPPQLLFVPDENTDDIPDGPPEVKLDGFTVARSNHHNFANGLRWGPDGWLWGRVGHSCPGNVGKPGTPEAERVPTKGGIWRYHPTREVFEMVTHGTTNPWGHDWDQYGQGFHINTVNGHLWHIIPGAHFKESFGQSSNPYIYERIDHHADHWHFDIEGKWQDSRDGAANAFGGGHAHVGMMIYQADQWPKQYRNKLFTLNMHGRRTNVERLEREGSGYVGRHEPDVFLSGDPWFRGIDIRQGPDGSAFILDWSDTGECHDHTGVHRTSGRVYRISYGTPEKPDLAKWSLTPKIPESLPEEHQIVRQLLEYSDFWPIDTGLGKRPASSVIPERPIEWLETVAAVHDSQLVQLYVASTLQRLPHAYRKLIALKLVERAGGAGDHNLPYMVWFGLTPLVETHPTDLVEVAKATEWPDLLRWIARALSSRIEHSPEALDSLLELTLTSSPHKQFALLSGVDQGLQGWRKAPEPANWDAVVAVLSTHDDPKAKEFVQGLGAVFGDGRAIDAVKAVALDRGADLNLRRTALQSLIDAQIPDLREICEKLINVHMLNTVAVKGLATFDDPTIGETLAKNYARFHPTERPTVIDTLTSRAPWASAMLQGVKSGAIQRADVTPYHARQILAFDDETLTKLLTDTWGQIRETDETRKQEIADWHTQLSPEALATADLSKGRKTYQMVCASCHQLYGQGGKFGPDLTGSGRANLDYLLENIVDPSGAVGADYQMTVVTLKDGRVLSGVIGAKNENTTVLRQLNEETTLQTSEIAKAEVQATSIMPEGLLKALTAEQVRDLIAYLMHPVQVE